MDARLRLYFGANRTTMPKDETMKRRLVLMVSQLIAVAALLGISGAARALPVKDPDISEFLHRVARQGKHSCDELKQTTQSSSCVRADER